MYKYVGEPDMEKAVSMAIVNLCKIFRCECAKVMKNIAQTQVVYKFLQMLWKFRQIFTKLFKCGAFSHFVAKFL